jgi:HK97 family phage major capsid protein
MRTVEEEISSLSAQVTANTAGVQDFAGKTALKLSAQDARLVELEQKLSRTAGGFGRAGQISAGSSAGALVAGSSELSNFVASGMRGKMRVEVKSFDDGFKPQASVATLTSTHGVGGTAAGVPVVADRRPDVVPLGRQSFFIRDLLAAVPTTSNMVEYVRVTNVTNNAAPVAENPAAPKPQSSMGFELVQSKVQTIAHWMLASKQILADAPSLQNTVDTELKYGLRLAEDLQLLLGDGTGTNLEGLMPQASAYAKPAGLTMPTDATQADILLAALLQAQIAGFPSTGIVLNPIDWAAIQLLKDSDGRYIVSSPQDGTPPLLWKRPVAESLAMPQNNFLVGAFGLAAQIHDREDAEVLVSTEDSDNFRRNLVTVLAEERLAFAVKRPEAFVRGQFS